jgi:phage-related holin
MQERLYKMILSLTSSAVFKLFEPSFPMLQALVIIMALDMVIGLYHSFNYEGKKFDPKMFLGKIKDTGMFIVILFATLSINAFWKQYGMEGQSVANFFISSFGFYHFFSILQNAGKMGFPIAGYFQKWIESKAPDLNGLKKGEEDETKK